MASFFLLANAAGAQSMGFESGTRKNLKWHEIAHGEVKGAGNCDTCRDSTCL